MDEIKKDTDNETANEIDQEINQEPELSVGAACIQHAREVMGTQLALLKDKEFDFAPQFQEMTIQLYLLGVVQKFAETLDEPEKGREHAFFTMQSMLLEDGMDVKKVKKQLELLKKMSVLEDGNEAHAVEAGYQSEPDDNSLVELFDEYISDYQVSGDFWRLFERIKKTMLYGGLVAFFVVVWIITLFLPDNSGVSILMAGVVAAAIFVVPTFLAGLIIFKVKMKKAKQAN